ncbi:MAG TPA: LuxR C-terminal-related transcriptional regulator [Streptosporangiaceae bacterium]|jgi:DNA-binding CsgD family transcriptional regulator
MSGSSWGEPGDLGQEAGPEPPLRGRERERDLLSAFITSAGAIARVPVLLLEGEKGSGKSRLIGAAVELAGAHGLRSGVGRASELGELDALEPLTWAIGEAAPPSGLLAASGVADSPALSRISERLSRLIRRGLSAGSLLICLDDLQWASRTTIAALASLSASLSAEPVCWVLTCRPAAGPSHAGRLFDLLEREGAARLRLGPLEPPAVHDIIVDLLHREPDTALQELASTAAGNPLLVTELVRGLREQDAIDVSADPARLTASDIPGRVRSIAVRLLADVGDGTRRLLETAAILQEPFVFLDVAELLGERPARLLPCLEEALTTGILATAPDGEAHVFRHELLRRAIELTIPAGAREAVHRQAGELMLRRGHAPGAAARHLLAGLRADDTTGLRRLDRLVTRMRAVDPYEAARLARNVLSATARSDPRRYRRAALTTDLLTAVGELDDAVGVSREMLAESPPVLGRAALSCSLSRALRLMGRYDDARAAAPDAAATPEIRDTVTAAAFRLQPEDEAARRAGTVLAGDGRRGDAHTAALQALAASRWSGGHLADALEMAREATGSGAAEDPSDERIQARFLLAGMLIDLGLHDQAAGPLDRIAADVQVIPVWGAVCAIVRARLHMANGRLRAAFDEAGQAVTAATTANVRSLLPYAIAVQWPLSLRVGEPEPAGRLLGEGAALRAYGTRDARRRLDLAIAQLEESRSGARAVLAQIGGLYDRLPALPGVLMTEPTTAPWLARCAVAADDRGRADAVVTAVTRLADLNPALTTVEAAAHHTRGLFRGDAGELRCAAAAYTDPWARASVSEDLGGLLAARTAGRDNAIAWMDRALVGFTAVGAEHDAARVRRGLRRLGQRRRHWRTAERPATGWPSLTERERSVAQVVAQGLTNRQAAHRLYVSANTIAFHLRQIYRKLQITSRVELARYVISAGDADQAAGSEAAHDPG